MSYAFQCPHCQKRLTTEKPQPGKTVICPGCKQQFTMPFVQASTTPENHDDLLPPVPSSAPTKQQEHSVNAEAVPSPPPPPPFVNQVQEVVAKLQQQATPIVQQMCERLPKDQNQRLLIFGGVAMGGFMLIVLCCCGGGLLLLGLDGTTEISVAEFLDNTPQYKGNSIEFEMTLNGGGHPLRSYSGRSAEFFLLGDRAEGVLVINIPSTVSLPNASQNDPLLVEFDCTEGRLRSGNIATRIRRP